MTRERCGCPSRESTRHAHHPATIRADGATLHPGQAVGGQNVKSRFVVVTAAADHMGSAALSSVGLVNVGCGVDRSPRLRVRNAAFAAYRGFGRPFKAGRPVCSMKVAWMPRAHFLKKILAEYWGSFSSISRASRWTATVSSWPGMFMRARRSSHHCAEYLTTPLARDEKQHRPSIAVRRRLVPGV
jgi:hypothetical protein